MTQLPEQVLDNAEVSKNRVTVPWRHRVSVAATNSQISGGMHLGFEDALDVLRGAKMNVFSLVPQVFSPCVYGPHLSGAILSSACAARRSCDCLLG